MRIITAFDNRLESEVPAKGLKALRNSPTPEVSEILRGRRLTCENCGCERYTICGCTVKV